MFFIFLILLYWIELLLISIINEKKKNVDTVNFQWYA